MASNPIERRNRNGTLSFRIEWREAGNPAKHVRTFRDLHSARTFKRLVELGGRGNNRYPGDEVLRQYGLVPTEDDSSAPAEAAPTGSIVTVGEAVLRYIDYKATDVHRPIGANWLDQQKSYYVNYIEGTSLAIENVATVQAKPILRWATEQRTRAKRRRGAGTIAASSVSQVLNFLGSVFDWAMMGISDPSPQGDTPLRPPGISPMQEVRAVIPRTGRSGSKEKQVLRNAEEYEVFFRCAYQIDPWWADMLVATAVTGMRFGEVTAIHREQVTAEWRSIWIDRHWSKRMLLPGTKSTRGENVVEREARIPESAWCVVEPYLVGKRSGKTREQMFDSIKRIRPEHRGDIVFDGPEYTYTRYWGPSSDHRYWKRLCDLLSENGLGRLGDFRHHHLRHSLATYLRNVAGIDGMVIKGVIGHSDSSVTGRYMHITPEMWKPVLAKLEVIALPVAELREPHKERYIERQRRMWPTDDE